jgi:hypothetical protein
MLEITKFKIKKKLINYALNLLYNSSIFAIKSISSVNVLLVVANGRCLLAG